MKSFAFLLLFAFSLSAHSQQGEYERRAQLRSDELSAAIKAQDQREEDYRNQLISQRIELNLHLPAGSVSYIPYTPNRMPTFGIFPHDRGFTDDLPHYGSADGSVQCVQIWGAINCLDSAGRSIGGVSAAQMKVIERRAPTNTFWTALGRQLDGHIPKRRRHATH